MIEQEPCLASQSAGIEGILHQEKHVHVIRICGIRNERSEKDESSNAASGTCHLMNACQTEGHSSTLRPTAAKPLEDLMKRGDMHTER
jgi:hypothetical protein